MENTMIIGLIAVVVVAFFAYQWWSVKQRSRARTSRPNASVVSGVSTTQVNPTPTATPLTVAPPKTEGLPDVAGQTEAEMRAKEPIQRKVHSTPQVAVMNDGTGPAEFGDSLRRPEQAYYEPGPEAGPNDVAAGRAGTASTPLSGHQQAFSPEMAQNGGAIVGTTVFAYDGMEPTELSSF